MSPSASKILWNFGGNVALATDYCENIAREYPRLTREYRAYREEILNHA